MEIFSGIIAGIISTLGMGGGTVLILILANFLGLEQHIAQSTNLIFFIPTAIVATIINYRPRLVDVKLGTILVVFVVIGTIIGVNISLKVESSNLKHYFGIFLLIIAIFEIYDILKKYKKKKKTDNSNE